VRFFRTGDRVRLLPGGEIDFLGRADRQVKIRGYRVELREIEEVLARQENVQESALKAHTEDGDARLTAYIVKRTGTELSVTRLRNRLKQSLPDYMIPAQFVLLDKLPRNFHGKVDANLLPEPGAVRPLLDTPFRGPETPEHWLVIGVWERLLKMNGIGIDDTFLDLGGDSLRAAEVLLELAERSGLAAPLEVLFHPGTPAAMAEQLTLA
jgi:acyl carrier protein